MANNKVRCPCCGELVDRLVKHKKAMKCEDCAAEQDRAAARIAAAMSKAKR